jgi:hypothetical protein
VMTDIAETETFIERAAMRVAYDDAFIASNFRDWCNGVLDLDAIAVVLSCTREAVVRAALCTRPRAGSFKQDTDAVAAHASIDPIRLATLLREVASVAAFRKGSNQQLLAAARDAPPDPDDQ